MADGENILTIRSRMLAEQLSPHDFLSSGYQGLHFTSGTSFSPRAFEVATAIIDRLPAKHRMLLVEQGHVLGEEAVKVLDKLRTHSAIRDTRQLIHDTAVACVIVGAFRLVSPNHFYTQKEWELLCSK